MMSQRELGSYGNERLTLHSSELESKYGIIVRTPLFRESLTSSQQGMLSVYLKESRKRFYIVEISPLMESVWIL